MGIEGGSRFEFHPQIGRMGIPEDPFGRGIEASGDHRIEDVAELENASWLSGFINPEKLASFREFPALAEHSDEWIIMEALLGQLVEKGAEMDSLQKARLRNLVGILRMAFYPNMHTREQEFIHDLVTKTTSVDFSSLTFDVTQETREDVRWIWETFGLDIPSESQRQLTPSGFYQMLDQSTHEG